MYYILLIIFMCVSGDMCACLCGHVCMCACVCMCIYLSLLISGGQRTEVSSLPSPYRNSGLKSGYQA